MRALVKLEQVLPAHLRRRVQALQRATKTLQVYGGPTGRPAVPDHARRRRAATTSACASPTPRATSAGTQREVEPHSLVNAGRRWYLVAWDCGRDGLAHVPRRPDRAGRRRPARASRRASCRPRTPPRTSSRACSPTASRYEARVTVARARPPSSQSRRWLGGDVKPLDERPLRAAHERRQPRLAGDADRDARPRPTRSTSRPS